jgi:hypothetical protein
MQIMLKNLTMKKNRENLKSNMNPRLKKREEYLNLSLKREEGRGILF